MAVRRICWVSLTLFAWIWATPERAFAQSTELELRPAACYLLTSEASSIVQSTQGMPADTGPTLPPGCDAPSADLYRDDHERYARSLTDLKERFATDIRRLGYRKLPQAVDIAVTPRCPQGWFGNGAATLRQHDFDLELVQSDKQSRGAIVRDYVVFFLATGPVSHAEGGFTLSVVYGLWTGDALVLRDAAGECISVLKARPNSSG